MKRPTILWQRLVNEGETCPRRDSTRHNVIAAIAKLEPLGVEMRRRRDLLVRDCHGHGGAIRGASKPNIGHPGGHLIESTGKVAVGA